MACTMNELKTKKLRAVQGTDKIEERIGYFKMHPHEICKCDGTKSLYRLCLQIRSIDTFLFLNGEDEGWYTYHRGKMLIRRFNKRIHHYRFFTLCKQ